MKKKNLIIVSIITFGIIFYSLRGDSRQDKMKDVMLFLKLQKIEYIEDEMFCEFQVQILNNSQKDISILKDFKPGSNGEPTHHYNLFISRNDTDQYFFSEGVFDKKHVPTKSEYSILKRMDSIFFSFKVSFTSLSKDPMNYCKVNTDFGEYRVFIEYYDQFPTHSDAIREKIRSNVINIKYEE